MTVYVELLRIALSQEHEADRSVDQLVSEALARRRELHTPADAAGRLAASLAYDSVLVLLCRRLGLQADLLGDESAAVARRKAERALAGAVPMLDTARR